MTQAWSHSASTGPHEDQADSTAFPSALGLSAKQTEDLISKAALAPSLHNSQPWRFRLLPNVIELHFDPQRRIPVADPEGRELRLACGAALFNLRLALQHHGIRPLVTLLPRLHGPTGLAAVGNGGAMLQTTTEEELYHAIPRRRSNRRPFANTPVPTQSRHALKNAVRQENCWLHEVKRPERGTLEGLVHRAHRAQMADQRFRQELERWTGRSPGVAEGVPATAAGPRREPQDQWVLREFSGSATRPRMPGKDFEQDPLLAVVCSYTSSRTAELQAGQALQRMLLTATVRGLATSVLSEVMEIGETREELQSMLGGSLVPQTLVRIGYGSPTPATPRRDPHELILDD